MREMLDRETLHERPGFITWALREPVALTGKGQNTGCLHRTATRLDDRDPPVESVPAETRAGLPRRRVSLPIGQETMLHTQPLHAGAENTRNRSRRTLICCHHVRGRG